MNNEENWANQEEGVFQICIKITNKDYKITLATKRAWVVGIVLVAIRITIQFWERYT